MSSGQPFILGKFAIEFSLNEKRQVGTIRVHRGPNARKVEGTFVGNYKTILTAFIKKVGLPAGDHKLRIDFSANKHGEYVARILDDTGDFSYVPYGLVKYTHRSAYGKGRA